MLDCKKHRDVDKTIEQHSVSLLIIILFRMYFQEHGTGVRYLRQLSTCRELAQNRGRNE
jgi:hypothetical protein